MIQIIKKLLLGLLGLLCIVFAVAIYANSKQPNFEKLKDLPPVTEHILDEIANEEEEENLEAEAEVSAITDFTSGIRERLKTAVGGFFHKDIKIVAIGDSLTQGVGDDYNAGGYIGILDRMINQEEQIATFENYGKRGNRTNQMLKRMEEEEEIKHSLAEADIILITIGANDIMQVAKENITNLHYLQFTRERVKYEERLNEILSIMRNENSKAHIFLLGIYNPFAVYFPNVEELSMIVDDWNRISNYTTTHYENTIFIPVKDLFSNNEENLFANDNFHPNSLGYYYMAERVLEFLTNIEAEGEADEEQEEAS